MAAGLGVSLVCLLTSNAAELSAPFQAIGYASLFYGFWPQLSRFKLVLAIACVGRMALTNYVLQTLICTTLFTTSVCLCILIAWSCWRLLFRYGWRISSSLLSGCVHFRQGRWNGSGVS